MLKIVEFCRNHTLLYKIVFVPARKREWARRGMGGGEEVINNREGRVGGGGTSNVSA